jgi:hypothetical protein
MTEHEQRVAIAEWMGWRFLEPESGMCLHPDGGRVPAKLVPDYVGDLNAVREATIKLTSAQKEQFLHWLMGICQGQAKAAYGFVSDDAFTALWMGTFASAAQRAEALLRTLGLWKEDAP